MTSAAISIFKALTPVRLADMITNKEPESIHLDYVSASSFGRDPNYNSENITKPLTGFANAEGGVILYGITCAGKDQGRDLPSAVEGKIHPGLRDAINAMASQHASPPVEGMDFASFIEPKSGGEVLAVLVPESQIKPHQSLDQKVYYRRFDDDVKPLDHSGVEVYFRTKLARELNVFPLVDLYEPPDMQDQHIKLTFINKGNAPALNLQLRVEGLAISESSVLGIRNEVWRVEFNGYSPGYSDWRIVHHKLSRGGAGVMTVSYKDLSNSVFEIRRRLEGPVGTPGLAPTAVTVFPGVEVYRNGIKLA